MNILSIFRKKKKLEPIKVENNHNNETLEITKILSEIDTISSYELITKITKLNELNRTTILNNPQIKNKLKNYILKQYKEDKYLKNLKQKLSVVEIISLLDINSIKEEYKDNDYEEYKIFMYLTETKEETYSLINYLLNNKDLLILFIKDIYAYNKILSYIDYDLCLKIVLKLNELKTEKYLYFFLTYLSTDIQKKLIEEKLEDDLLITISHYLNEEALDYLFKIDKRVDYLYPNFRMLELINKEVIFPNSILTNSNFFNMLKSKSLITFRTTIDNLEKRNLPESIEYQVKKYYEDLINNYNEEYDMFNDYVNIINVINKLNNNINFDNYILDNSAKNIYKEYLKKKDSKIFEEYKLLTNKKLSEIIVDYLFQDNIYNVFYNIKEMFRFNNKLSENEQIVNKDKQIFYKIIFNIDKLTNQDKIRIFNEYKNQNINLMFYEDLRKLKDKSYELINSKLFSYKNYCEDKLLSFKYNTKIYDLRNKEFFMLVRGEDNHQEKTTTRRNCYSIISNDNTNVFCNGATTIYGYNYLDINKVLHVHERDSYSYDLNEKMINPKIKINRIMTSEELSNGCSWYSEIQIINSKDKDNEELYIAKKPDYIVAIDDISKRDILESQRLQIPIILINNQLLEPEKIIDIGSTIDYDEEYVTEYYEEAKQKRIYRLK